MKMRRFLVALGLAATALLGQAQPVALNLIPPDHAVTAGSKTSVDLVILNRTATEQTFVAPATLAARLTLGAQTWPVELRAAPASLASEGTLAPGNFATRTYLVTLPADVVGTAIVTARFGGLTTLRGVIDIAAPVAAKSSPSTPRVDPPTAPVNKPITNLARAEPAGSIIQRTFAGRLAPHEPIYFIYGPDAPAAKFQFSFKYKVLAFTELSRERMARTLQFAFTQRSLWDINGESSPFYDTSYMPEIIFESLAAKPEAADTSFTWLGYQAALKHESNGRDGPLSRSLNTVYFRAAFAFGKLDGWHLLVVPELFAYLTPLDNNPDLKDYRGYGQLRLVVGRNDGPSLMATLWAGKDFQHPSTQLDFTVPVRTQLLNFETYLLIQYFNGYGESLLSYRDKTETVRAGFSLVR